jgi:hypothetical protein
MQDFAAHPKAVSRRKAASHRRTIILKPNAAKSAAIGLAQCNAEFTEYLEPIRQEPFTACFCYWWSCAIHDGYSKAALPRCDCGGKSRRTSAYDQHI